jgi:hypothetical protein
MKALAHLCLLKSRPELICNRQLMPTPLLLQLQK